ncbi:MAG: YraN family protein [Oscillospiraceae bacterium]|nr:YraN family protein [Oscillospiraceae bacterium]
MTTGEIGAWGEDRACEYLTDKGYRIIRRNFSSRTGEIDIICKKGNMTVFVEVKTRRSSVYAEPRDFVTFSKQRKLKSAAKWWLSLTKSYDFPARFDVIEVFSPDGLYGKDYSINHIENAF